MNPIYKFELATEYNGVTNNYAVSPLYKDDLAKDFELHQNEKFYRAKLSGKLRFIRNDYAIVANARFETKFTLVISISWNRGGTWAEYWRGHFWKTDCDFDADGQTLEVTPTPVDEYTAVLAGMEKEYNLIDLKPEIENLKITKRPLIQMYVPGESVVSCFLSGMYWEQDCTPEDNENALVNTYHFGLNSQQAGQVVSGTGVADGSWYDGHSADNLYYWTFETKKEWVVISAQQRQETFVYTYLTRRADGVRLFANRNMRTAAKDSFSLYRYDDESRESVAEVVDVVIKVYARFLLDAETINGNATSPIPADDIVENNRNYRRVYPYLRNNAVTYSVETTTTPTEWGINQPGHYWVTPDVVGVAEWFPVGRSHWGAFSVWFAFSPSDILLEERGRKEYVLKDAYPLHSVLSVVLGKIAPGITHEPTPEYSQFLYDENNPISDDVFSLYITPKSNILAGDYSQPAMKAPITLKMLTDMLRDCYRAYWYIENGKFKVEHIQWFKNGGRYTGNPAISHDLTVEQVTRNGKPWAFATSKFDFNKPTMPERYQFGWMDDVTRAFEGFPIDVVSQYVTPGNIEEISLSNFTTDVDYMLLNPGACSKDGYALMAAVPRQLITQDSEYRDMGDGGYNVLYTLANVQENENITLHFLTSGFGIYDIAFFDASNNLLQTIGTFSASQQEHTISANAPAGATKIGMSLFSRMGSASIKMLSIQGMKELPIVMKILLNGVYINQNGLLAFIDLLPKYYIYDLPAYNVVINEQSSVAYGITREKKQTLRFPVVDDPNPMQLIKTYLGDGQVEKLSVNLSSRSANATLMYDTHKPNE